MLLRRTTLFLFCRSMALARARRSLCSFTANSLALRKPECTRMVKASAWARANSSSLQYSLDESSSKLRRASGVLSCDWDCSSCHKASTSSREGFRPGLRHSRICCWLCSGSVGSKTCSFCTSSLPETLHAAFDELVWLLPGVHPSFQRGTWAS